MREGDCPWSHATRGECVLAEHHSEPHRFRDETDPPVSLRAAGALAQVKSALDAAIRAFQNARSIAVEEGSPLPEAVDDDIMAALVKADTMVRTQASLRTVRERVGDRSPRRPGSVLKSPQPTRDGGST